MKSITQELRLRRCHDVPRRQVTNQEKLTDNFQCFRLSTRCVFLQSYVVGRSGIKSIN